MQSDEPVFHKVGYARVSTLDQDMRLQIEALTKDGVDPSAIYKETISGASKRRPKFDSMMRDLHKNDVVVVWKLDRLGRTAIGLLNTAQAIEAKGAKLRVLTQQIDTSTPAGALMMHMLAAFAQFERDLTIERTKAAVAAAKAAGRVGGAPRKYDDATIKRVLSLIRDGSTKAAALRTEGMSLQQFNRRLKAMKGKKL